VTTLLRICEALEVNLVRLLRGLDAGIYESRQVSKSNRLFSCRSRIWA
jgi:hypothetical protein